MSNGTVLAGCLYRTTAAMSSFDRVQQPLNIRVRVTKKFISLVVSRFQQSDVMQERKGIWKNTVAKHVNDVLWQIAEVEGEIGSRSRCKYRQRGRTIGSVG